MVDDSNFAPFSREIRRQMAALQRALAGNAVTSVRNVIEANMIPASRIAATNVEEIRRKLATIAGASSYDAMIKQVREIVQSRTGPVAQALDGFRRLWGESLPPNWKDLEVTRVMELIEVMQETGYCLVWTPRPEIVQSVLDADPGDLPTLLLSRRDDILDDLSALLSDVRHADLTQSKAALTEAIADLRDEKFMSAQALSAVVFSEIIHGNFGKELYEARELFREQNPKDASMQQLRLRAIFVGAGLALERAKPLDPAHPPQFNRHSSLHRLVPPQYTEHNALVGLMLVVPLLREVDFWLHKQSTNGSSTRGE